MAAWCVATGFAPDVYRTLTVREARAFVDEVKRQRSK